MTFQPKLPWQDALRAVVWRICRHFVRLTGTCWAYWDIKNHGILFKHFNKTILYKNINIHWLYLIYDSIYPLLSVGFSFFEKILNFNDVFLKTHFFSAPVNITWEPLKILTWNFHRMFIYLRGVHWTRRFKKYEFYHDLCLVKCIIFYAIMKNAAIIVWFGSDKNSFSSMHSSTLYKAFLKILSCLDHPILRFSNRRGAKKCQKFTLFLGYHGNRKIFWKKKFLECSYIGVSNTIFFFFFFFPCSNFRF